MFFHTLRDAWKFFSCNCITLSQQITNALLSKAFPNIANK